MLSVLVNLHADSSPRPELCSRPETADVLLREGLALIWMIGSFLAKPEVAGGLPPTSDIPFPASSYPQPELAFGSELSALQSLLEIDPKELGVSTILESADSGEAVVVWTDLGSLDSSGSSPCGAVPPVSTFSPQNSQEDSLVVVPPTHTSHSSGYGLKYCMDLELIPEEEPTPLSCCPVDKFRGISRKRSSPCDGFEDRLSALFEDIVATNDEKEALVNSVMK